MTIPEPVVPDGPSDPDVPGDRPDENPKPQPADA